MKLLSLHKAHLTAMKVASRSVFRLAATGVLMGSALSNATLGSPTMTMMKDPYLTKPSTQGTLTATSSFAETSNIHSLSPLVSTGKRQSADFETLKSLLVSGSGVIFHMTNTLLSGIKMYESFPMQAASAMKKHPTATLFGAMLLSGTAFYAFTPAIAYQGLGFFTSKTLIGATSKTLAKVLNGTIWKAQDSIKQGDSNQNTRPFLRLLSGLKDSLSKEISEIEFSKSLSSSFAKNILTGIAAPFAPVWIYPTVKIAAVNIMALIKGLKASNYNLSNPFDKSYAGLWQNQTYSIMKDRVKSAIKQLIGRLLSM